MIPFEMVKNEYYMCYILDQGQRIDWTQAQMAVMRYTDVQYRGNHVQPIYEVVESSSPIYPGSAVVLPFKKLGCQWPPHPGEDAWT